MQPEDRQLFRRYERIVERDLRKDRPKLFEALAEFANIRPDKDAWSHFRKRWPAFFLEEEYDRALEGAKRSVLKYPYWLGQIWIGAEDDPYLRILLGIETAPDAEEGGTPEDSRIADLPTIGAQLYAYWGEGLFCYYGACDFQRALYLLFRESWRARICEQCGAKFIAGRAGQKYCTTDCSGKMQRDLKRGWWTKHGEAWRRKRMNSRRKKRGGSNGTGKAR